MPRFSPRNDRSATQSLSQQDWKNRRENEMARFSDAKRKELMRQVRASKAAHPKANDAFHLAQSVFLTENRLNKRQR